MSNYLAIATTTAGLVKIIDASIKRHVAGSEAVPLKPSVPVGTLPNPGVTVFLYQVMPNAAYRNTDLPTRSADGDVLRRPRVALDLHYLLSFHGEESNLIPQRLLGSTVSALHSQPLLSRALIHQIIQDRLALDPTDFLATSDLEYEVELVKFTPLSLSLEELSKLWSVFFQTAYSLSMAYLATVVLIESDLVTRPPLPVLSRHLLVLPFRQPLIEAVEPQMVNPGARITIKGQNLKSDNLRLVFNGTQPATPVDIKDREITVDVPADLRSGVNTVKIVHDVFFGTPEPHRGFESNAGVFIVRPVITTNAIVQASTVVNGTTYQTGYMTVNFTAPVARRQRVVLLLNEYNPPTTVQARSYSFAAPVGNGITDPAIPETSVINIPFQNVVNGTYLVRVRVDEAESELQVDPATGIFASPQELI
ncbi:MAG: DUF4255 domain-containing protein [Deltaproteobacteria bacterium]|nr:DUF4255 domain-containing protein [Deltaproteobacteria bacterium]